MIGKDKNMTYPSEVVGDHSGLRFPVSYAVLEQGGAARLGELFHGLGTLSADNSVTAITHWAEFLWRRHGPQDRHRRQLCPQRGAADAAVREVHPSFGDPLRELFSPVMDPEARFALLSRRPDFPIAVPRCLFADYNAAHKTGLLITERLPYGEEGIERALEKCV